MSSLGAWLPWIVGGACFALYIAAATIGAGWHDGGELALASWTLSVGHPPGEPAYLQLGKLAALLPVGDLCFRLTLLSAGTMAAAVGLFCALLGGWLRSWPGIDERSATLAAGLGAALLAVLPASILQGTRPELYALVLLLVLLGLSALRIPGPRGLALAVLPLCVLGAVHHALLVGALPALLWIALRRGRRDLLHALVAAIAILPLGLSQFAWLPLRSRLNPVLDYGVPRTVERVLYVALAKGYAGSFRLDGAKLLANLRDHAHLFVEELGWLSFALISLAVLASLRARRPAALGLGLLFLLGGSSLTLLQGVFDAENPDARGYLLIPLAACCVAVGLGSASLLGFVDRRAPRLLLLVSLASLLGLCQPSLASGLARVAWAPAASSSIFAASLLEQPPPGALILLGGDSWAYPALLLRYHEGRRPDLDVLPFHMLSEVALPGLVARGLPVRAELRLDEARVLAAGDHRLQPELLLRTDLLGGPDHPLFVNEVLLPPELYASRIPRGWLYEIGADPRQAWIGDSLRDEERLWERCVRPLIHRPGFAADGQLQRLLSERYGGRAGFWRGRGDAPMAKKLLSLGSEAVPKPWALIHLLRYRMEVGEDGVGAGAGVVVPGPWTPISRRGQDVMAAQMLREALKRATPDEAADLRILLAHSLLFAGQPAAARALVEGVLRGYPTHPLGLLIAARLRTLGETPSQSFSGPGLKAP